MTTENTVKRKVKALMDSVGAYSLTVTTGGMGESGHPDRIACLHGMFIGIECKRTAKEHPTPLQKLRLASITNAGGHAFVVDDDNFPLFRKLIEAIAANPKAYRAPIGSEFHSTAYWR